MQNTWGIVLRSVKYGETSLVCTVFTELYGTQAYLVQGVRSASRSNRNRAGLLRPATLLDMTVYHKPNANLQRIKEFHPAYIYNTLQQHVVKNSVALFSAELLLRLLPEHAPIPELFSFCYDYFTSLDVVSPTGAANYPLYFVTQCSSMLGYSLNGSYSADTPHLNLQEGGFSSHLPSLPPYVPDEDAMMLSKLIAAETLEGAAGIQMNAAMRFRLLDWFLAFLHNHTQHMGELRSLPVLRAILH